MIFKTVFYLQMRWDSERFDNFPRVSPAVSGQAWNLDLGASETQVISSSTTQTLIAKVQRLERTNVLLEKQKDHFGWSTGKY